MPARDGDAHRRHGVVEVHDDGPDERRGLRHRHGDRERALQAAHSRGILHRDIKPENLMFSSAGALKVTDFGIAAVVGGDQTLANEQGEVIGTPAYMAPEQALGQALSPATDVFAAGVLLYELLTGQLPYSAEGGPVETLQRHAYDDPIQINQVSPTLPAPLAAVVMKALARRPEDRYQTAEEFGVALAEAATTSWKPGWLNPTTGRLTFGTDPLGAAAQRGTMATPGTAPARRSCRAPRRRTRTGPTANPTPTVIVGSASGEGRHGAALDSDARPDAFVNAGRVVAGKKPLVPYLIGLRRDRARRPRAWWHGLKRSFPPVSRLRGCRSTASPSPTSLRSSTCRSRSWSSSRRPNGRSRSADEGDAQAPRSLGASTPTGPSRQVPRAAPR